MNMIISTIITNWLKGSVAVHSKITLSDELITALSAIYFKMPSFNPSQAALSTLQRDGYLFTFVSDPKALPKDPFFPLLLARRFPYNVNVTIIQPELAANGFIQSDY
jgi:hypothetical protein